ncbi:helicase associated domain-containing protein [Streptomyces sp. NPDC002870]|uniref:helicase associated domain-containing protein n=1 Tax=Streptomyces sp. NPDC002870 TaxID=3364666 RepID=UPI0036BF6CB5
MAPRTDRRPPLPPHPPPPRRPPDLRGRWRLPPRHLAHLATPPPHHRRPRPCPHRRPGAPEHHLEPRQQAWDRGLAHAAAFAALHGHLAVPVDHHHDDFALGRWLATQRTALTSSPRRAPRLSRTSTRGGIRPGL